LKKNLKQRILKGKINFKEKLVNGETSSQFIIKFKMLLKLTLKQQPNWKQNSWLGQINLCLGPTQWGKKANLVHLLINQNLSRKISSKVYMVNRV
jgi:hypothetical protein